MAVAASLQHIIPTAYPFCISDNMLFYTHAYGLHGIFYGMFSVTQLKY